jgi:hypothetical protein
MFSGFQSNAFQRNAFQIVTSVTPPDNDNGWLGGGGDYTYHRPYDKLREDEYQRKLARERARLKTLEQELAEAEKRKQQAEVILAEQKAARAQAALEKQILAQIRRLSLERAALIRRIDEDEATLVLLLMAARRRSRRLTN